MAAFHLAQQNTILHIRVRTSTKDCVYTPGPRVSECSLTRRHGTVLHIASENDK